MANFPKPGQYVRLRGDATIYEVVSYAAGAGRITVMIRHPYRSVDVNDIEAVVSE